MPLEIEHLKNDEASWWYIKNIKATYQLETRIQRFMKNLELYQHNENFAYEGIFDKKEERSTSVLPFDRSILGIKNVRPTEMCKRCINFKIIKFGYSARKS